MGSDHGKSPVGCEVGEEVIFLAHRTEVLPAQAQIQSECRRQPKIILREEAETIVVGGPLGVAGIDQDKTAEAVVLRTSGIEICERVHDRVGIKSNTGRELENSSLHIVVEVFDAGAAELTAEFQSVFAAQPSEVVEDLVGLAGSSAGHAETNCAQIFNSGKVEFWQAEFSGPQIQTIRHRVIFCIERAEGCPIATVAKSDLVDLGSAQSRLETC